MKKLWFTRLVVLLIVACMLLGVVGCKEKTPAPVDAGAATPEPEEVVPDTYTYNWMMGSNPLNWNPHAWEMSNESDLMALLGGNLMDITIGPDGSNFEWVYDACSAVTDITATFADRDAWGITETKNRVYQIDLRPEMKWEDGTPINADSYVYSMKQLLDPTMKNYRANSYFVGSSAIANAAGYYNNDLVGQPKLTDNVSGDNSAFIFAKDAWVLGADGRYTGPNGEMLVFALTSALNYLSGDTLEDYAGYFQESYDKLIALGDKDGMVPITDETLGLLLGFITSADWGNEPEEYIANYVYYQSGVYEETPWEKVGLLKTGDYQIVYILEDPETMFYFLTGLTSSWLVHEGKYEAGKETVEDLVATNYCTSLDTSMSCGPYKLISFEVDKQLVLGRNENWYGYSDPALEGQFQADFIKIDIVGDHNTAMQLFNQGNLDEVELVSDDMATYRMSDYLLKTDQTYTFRYIFASDLTTLTNLEAEAGDGANKKVLSYDDFRKALSYAIDRARLCAEATPAYKPAYYLLNNLYYTDIENDPESQYRKTTDAKEAVLRLYGVEYGAGKTYADVDAAYAAITGYDLDVARELFQGACDQAIADGNYTAGQAINITCMCSASESLTADDTRQQDLLNEFVAEATKGTGFEGKITFKFLSGSKTRYDDVASGKVEMIRGAWGGAAFYPFSTIRVYCEPEYMGGLQLIHESNGWDPSKELLTITYDFNGDGAAETIENTLQEWAKSINNQGVVSYDDPKVKLAILSNLETAILSSYQCIPWSTETMCTLYSKKIEWATTEYNIMYTYGGIRLMTFNYTDAEWAEYVASQGGTLNYE